MAKPNHEPELSRLGRRVAEAQSRVDGLRAQLDERLFYRHEQGVSIAALARATGLSRETVYRAIKRSQLGS